MSESKRSVQEIMESPVEMQGDGVEIGEPTANTPILAALTLQMAQTYLLELMQAEGPEGDTDKAFQHVQKELDLLRLDTRPLSEH